MSLQMSFKAQSAVTMSLSDFLRKYPISLEGRIMTILNKYCETHIEVYLNELNLFLNEIKLPVLTLRGLEQIQGYKELLPGVLSRVIRDTPFVLATVGKIVKNVPSINEVILDGNRFPQDNETCEGFKLFALALEGRHLKVVSFQGNGMKFSIFKAFLENNRGNIDLLEVSNNEIGLEQRPTPITIKSGLIDSIKLNYNGLSKFWNDIVYSVPKYPLTKPVSANLTHIMEGLAQARVKHITFDFESDCEIDFLKQLPLEFAHHLPIGVALQSLTINGPSHNDRELDAILRRSDGRLPEIQAIINARIRNYLDIIQVGQLIPTIRTTTPFPKAVVEKIESFLPRGCEKTLLLGFSKYWQQAEPASAVSASSSASASESVSSSSSSASAAASDSSSSEMSGVMVRRPKGRKGLCQDKPKWRPKICNIRSSFSLGAEQHLAF